MAWAIFEEGIHDGLPSYRSAPVKARRNTYGSYQSLPWGTSLPCGVPQELFFMAKMRYFRGTGTIFPRLALL
jgi:hypothetical protein